MSESKYTPGQWFVRDGVAFVEWADKNMRGVMNLTPMAFVDAERKWFVEVNGRAAFNADGGEAHANAALIAAAPDLAAACALALHELRNFCPTVSGDAITACESALAKAGVTP